MGTKSSKPILYKIYYGETLVYLGRTTQPLQTRLRGHFFKKPMYRVIDINQVSRIECAEFATVADMYLYEIYYINRLKPTLNVDDLARDEVTVTLPEVEFVQHECPLFERWKADINGADTKWQKLHDEYYEIPQQISILRKRKFHKEISEDEFWKQHDIIRQRERELSKLLFGR